MENKLINAKITTTVFAFTLPYLLSSFLQTFYGMADLLIVGRFNAADSLTAVSIGSQFMHMVTVIIIGIAMGITIHLGYAVGGQKYERVSEVISNSIVLFLLIAAILMAALMISVNGIIRIMDTPEEAVSQMKDYLWISFIGIPFIIAYNVISAIFRGIGDSKTPMYIIGIACALNVLLDFLFVGGFEMKAAGAALATVIAQGVSFFAGLLFLKKKDFGFRITAKPSFNKHTVMSLLKTGMPVALQDGVIQVSFLVITVFANGRGLIDAGAVGITEKLISFFFLVPSAFLGSTSALISINAGAEKYKRIDQILKFALTVCIVYGIAITVICQIIPSAFLSMFTNDAQIIAAGVNYLRPYSADTLIASIHFCFSGYFCGLGYTSISFIHNVISAVAVRIPGSYIACRMFTDSLLPMGCAAPLGSLLSILICLGFFIYLRKKPIKKLS